MANYMNVLQKDPTEILTTEIVEQNNEPKLSVMVKTILDPIITLNKEKGQSTILDQIYTDGLDSIQIWEQSKLVIDNAVESLMFTDIPLAKALAGDDSEEESEISDSDNEVGESNNNKIETRLDSDSEYEDYQRIKESQPELNDEDPKEDELNSELEKEEKEEEEEREEVEDAEEQKEDKNEGESNKNGYGLNDGFFALDDFKKHVLELEEKGDMLDDDEEEIDYFGEITDGSEDEVDFYDDFFDKPKEKNSITTSAKNSKKSVRFNEEEEDSEFGADEYEAAMNSAKLDLFADEPEIKQKKGEEEELSTLERQQRQIQKQIAELEKEAIDEKKWTMKGEASVKSRPTDALLDEELEFDRNAKPVPVISQEFTESIEDLIRRRVKNFEFDDLPRRLFSDVMNERFKNKSEVDMNEMGKKSQKSLAEIYEDEHYKGVTEETKVSEELEAAHNQIIEMFQTVNFKLDALCSAHYIPKPASKTLEIKVNTSAITMEDAQPLTMSTESTLAPQEIFNLQKGINKRTGEVQLNNGMIVNKDELSKEQKKAMRAKNKRKGALEESEKRKKTKKSKKTEILDTLKQANVTVIDKRGAKTDLAGNIIKEGGKSKTTTFKL